MTGQTLLIANAIVLAFVLGLCVYAGYSLYNLRRLKDIFVEQGRPENLEEILSSIAKKLKALDKKTLAQHQYLEKLEHQLQFAAQKFAVVKFNSFSDQGGNLSFVIAMLDQKDSGLVLTNMHGREQNRIYTKVVTNGVSEATLTDEEQLAVNKAMSEWKKQIHAQKQTGE